MFLLDTCTLIWLTSQQTQMTPHVLGLIAQNPDKLFVSAVNAWEIGHKVNKGSLRLLTKDETVEDWFNKTITKHGLIELPITAQIAARSTVLPNIHRDPGDRLLIATAMIHRLTILTPDSAIRQYSQVKTAW